MLNALTGTLTQVAAGASSGSGSPNNNTSQSLNITTFALNATCIFPHKIQTSNQSYDRAVNLTSPLTRCRKDLGFSFPHEFADCLPRGDKPREYYPGWWFWKNNQRFQVKKPKVGLLTTPWIYSNVAGGVTDLAPFSVFNASIWKLTNATGEFNTTSLSFIVKQFQEMQNVTLGKNKVCGFAFYMAP